jgi:uncharacterized protein with ParB-like and HNH nuclease domain
MKATETDLKRVMSHADQQFIVPLFQRTYSWNKKEWQDLWNDLLELYDSEEPKSHFIGAIVTIPIENINSQSIAQRLLIDGQQRLTTISILLILIRNIAIESFTDEMLGRQIEEQYLINSFAKSKNERYKLRPTQQDRLIFEALIDQQEIPNALTNTLLAKCYEFFEAKLKRKKINLDQLFQILVGSFSVVKIELDSTDNPHIIFESLNAKGKPLTQADLIRNHFLMKIPSDQQEEVFKKYWQPMQEGLGDNLTECIRHYLMGINATFIKKNEVYTAMKKFIVSKNILDSLKELASYAQYYQKILFPSFEPSLTIRQALKRINHVEVTTAYPFLLRCYYDYNQDHLTEENFCTILHFVENFMIRRSVCNVPTNSLNSIFPTIYRETKENVEKNYSSFIEGFANILQKKGYPKDDEFRESILNNAIYDRSAKLERTKLILWSLERELNNSNGYVVDLDQLHIEFILPQKIQESNWWQRHLGEDWETDHELLVNTLGNLTLVETKLISNLSFPEKQKLLAQSNLELNRGFSVLLQWKKEQIEQRAEELADLALKVWAYFGEKKTYISQQSNYDEVTNTSPIYLLIKDEEFNVSTWSDVLINTLNFLAKEEPEIFEKLAIDYPKFINNNEAALRRATLLINGYYAENNLSTKDIYLFCKQAVEFAGFSKDDWQVDYK